MSEEIVMTIDTIREYMGDDAAEFISVMETVQQMIEHPETFHGGKATMEAIRLAALRTKISMKAQFYKTSEDKSMANRRKKDVFMALYASLEENINALKLAARIDAKSAGIL